MGNKLFVKQRREEILHLLRKDGTVRVRELSRIFNVSEVTIRTDLEKLEKDGILFRVYGGAVDNIGTGLDTSFAMRAMINRELKRRIAAKAASMIQEGDTISIDAGTTTMEIARQLPGNLRFTVITNAPNIAMEAASREKISVYMVGGFLSPNHVGLVGSDAEATIRSFYTNKAFVPVLSFDLERGWTDSNIPNARVKRAFFESTKQAIVVADSTKYGKVAPVVVAPLSAVHTLIIDSSLSNEDVQRLRDAGLEVVLV